MDTIRVKAELPLNKLLKPDQVMVSLTLYLYLWEHDQLRRGDTRFLTATSIDMLCQLLPEALVELFHTYKDLPMELIVCEEELLNFQFNIFDMKYVADDEGNKLTEFKIPSRSVLPAYLACYYPSGTEVPVSWVDADDGVELEPFTVSIP